MGAQETLGVQSRRESGQGRCPRGQFLSRLDSQPLWMALPLPPAVPLPLHPGLSAPIAAPVAVAHGLPVCASQRRDLLRRGLKPLPRGRTGGLFWGGHSPGTGQDTQVPRWSPPEPVSADTASAQLTTTTAGRAAREWGGVRAWHRRRGAAVGTPQVPGQSLDLQGQDSSWTVAHGGWTSPEGLEASTEREAAGWAGPAGWAGEPQPQRPPQDPSPPSPEALASTAGTGDQQRPCSQSVSSLTPPRASQLSQSPDSVGSSSWCLPAACSPLVPKTPQDGR